MITTIVICTQPQYRYLDKLLYVVASESDNVIVVYDASASSGPSLPTAYANVKFIAACKPFSGFGAGWCRDVGIKYAMQHLKQDRFVFIDGDCIPAPCSVQALGATSGDIVIGSRFDVSEDGTRITPCRTSNSGPIDVSDELCLSHSVLLSCAFSASSVVLQQVIDMHSTWLGEARVFPSVFDGTWGGEDSALASAAYLLGCTFVQLEPEACRVYHQYHDRTHTYTVDGLNVAVSYHGVLRTRLGK